jgi:hypothetical protein
MIKTFDPKKINKQPLIILVSAAGLILILLLTIGAASYHNTITPDGIIIHHSAFTITREGSPVNMKVLENAHRRRGFGAFYWGRTYYIGYHYIIYPDGRVEQGRPEHCVGAHASGHNSTLGICLIGNFSSKSNPGGEQGALEPTEAQIDALVNLCHDLRARYRIRIERIQRHHDVNRDTECPGDRFSFEAFAARLNQR